MCNVSFYFHRCIVYFTISFSVVLWQLMQFTFDEYEPIKKARKAHFRLVFYYVVIDLFL